MKPERIAPIAVRAFSAVSAAGIGQAALHAALREGTTRLSPNRFGDPTLPTWVGAVAGLDDEAAGLGAPAMPAALAARWDARATRLAWLGLVADDFIAAARTAVARHGAARVGLALGTSASTIAVSEAAYRALAADGGFPPALRSRTLNTPHALAMFVAEALGLAGPAVTVSTACSSSAKVFAVAERWLRLELVDAVVAGGVDALCQSVLYGFAALGLVSPAPCRPFDRRRDGISIGEAAGFALLERAPGNQGAQAGDSTLQLIGYGEANDAHHMSSPHPGGRGAELAIDDALARAGLNDGRGAAVDYVNLHGTASPKNDEVEAALLARRYGPHTRASATKGLTGHTMGAAGMLEAAICLLALRHGLAPGTTGCDEGDAALDARLVREPLAQPLRIAASHSFGFGGNNAVLVFARELG
jgi:3-oxoacyl-[acyl-carrier-protein] synthase-1